MDKKKREMPWIERVEELITILEGSSIGELELTEAGTHIVIRRRPDMMIVSVPVQDAGAINRAPTDTQAGVIHQAPTRPLQEDRSVPIISPMTGVYYSSPSPTSPPFVTIGSNVAVGQVIALIEAMKVFNEIQAEVAGRVKEMVAVNGEVVQKGDALIKVEPM